MGIGREARGFVNGLAIVIFLAQMTQFQVPGTAEASGHGMSGGEWLSGWPLILMLLLVALTMAIIWGLPKLTKAIPAPLAGIAIVAAVGRCFALQMTARGMVLTCCMSSSGVNWSILFYYARLPSSVRLRPTTGDPRTRVMLVFPVMIRIPMMATTLRSWVC